MKLDFLGRLYSQLPDELPGARLARLEIEAALRRCGTGKSEDTP